MEIKIISVDKEAGKVRAAVAETKGRHARFETLDCSGPKADEFEAKTGETVTVEEYVYQGRNLYREA